MRACGSRSSRSPSTAGASSRRTCAGSTAAGRSPATSIDDYAGDVIDLLDALHIEQAVIGGLSMGGYVTFAMFRHAPRYFRGMVLADTRPQADTPEAVEGRQKMLQLVREKGAGGGSRRDDAEAARRIHARDRPEVVDRRSAA